jgi:protein phosphatase
MKIVIISDLHGNLEAFRAMPEAFDELWVLGDLVSYGPNPAEVVNLVRAQATVVVRGNHDHAAGTRTDPCCSVAFRAMAAATLAYTDSQLNQEQRDYLARLPVLAERTVAGCRFLLCHAVPSEPLYTYCPEESPRWAEETAKVRADILLVGHTHIPFRLSIAGCTVVNPGSLGQPKQGQARACYAVWEDGRIELKSYVYPVAETIRKIQAMSVSEEVRRDLAEVLRTGAVAARLVPARRPQSCSDY